MWRTGCLSACRGQTVRLAMSIFQTFNVFKGHFRWDSISSTISILQTHTFRLSLSMMMDRPVFTSEPFWETKTYRFSCFGNCSIRDAPSSSQHSCTFLLICEICIFCVQFCCLFFFGVWRWQRAIQQSFFIGRRRKAQMRRLMLLVWRSICAQMCDRK